jgi:hypothetical protein
MIWVVVIAIVAIVLAGGAWVVAQGKAGDPGKVLYSPKRGTSLAINGVLALVYAGFGVAIPLVIITSNHSNASAHVGNVQLTRNERSGRRLFGEHCAVCHTLAGANAVGKVGPNLDQIQPNYALVVHTVQNGCLQNPGPSNPNEFCLGYGTMPSNVVQGQQVNEVAAFVAAVAGKKK